MSHYDTTRDLLADDLIEVNEILDALAGAGPELTDREVIVRLARAVKHVLIITEGRRKNHDRT